MQVLLHFVIVFESKKQLRFCYLSLLSVCDSVSIATYNISKAEIFPRLSDKMKSGKEKLSFIVAPEGQEWKIELSFQR